MNEQTNEFRFFFFFFLEKSIRNPKEIEDEKKNKEEEDKTNGRWKEMWWLRSFSNMILYGSAKNKRRHGGFYSIGYLEFGI